MVYDQSAPLAAVIASHPAVLSLLNRLGIFLGVGNDSIAGSAERHGIDPRFLTVMLNTYLNSDFFPEDELKEFPVKGICNYLVRTNNYYIEVQLPNVAMHFRHLVGRSFTPDTNLNYLFDYFNKVKEETEKELRRENALLEVAASGESHVFPEAKEEEEGTHPGVEALNDLVNLFIIHLKGQCDPNLSHAVITALISLLRDMRQNNRIHDRILLPLLRKEA